MARRHLILPLAALLLGLVPLLPAAPAAAADAPGIRRCHAVRSGEGQTLTVRVTGLRSTQGEVSIQLYGDQPERFLTADGRLARHRLAAATAIETCFSLPQPGDYAVAVFHDEAAGVRHHRHARPDESAGRGYSNDPPRAAGTPDFRAVRFQVRPGVNSVSIAVRY